MFVCVTYTQAERSELYGNDGLVRERRAVGRVYKKRKHSGRRQCRKAENGRGQILQSVQQQRSDGRSAKSPYPGTGVDVQDGRR